MRIFMMVKARKMPVGTVSRGRKKVADGKWVSVKEREKKDIGVKTRDYFGSKIESERE